jgi:hypothetical protein
MKQKVNLLNELTDEQLVLTIQPQYEAYRSGGHWLCDCGKKIPHYNRYRGVGKVALKVKCPACGEKVERFITIGNESFDSLEFNELFRRYEEKIRLRCDKFNGIEESGNVSGDMNHRFYISVMTFNGLWKFSTYVWNNIKRRFEDFERKNSRACKNNTVLCPLCGRYVGAITRIHLMANKSRPKHGYPGHQVLHAKIINDIGINKFALLGEADPTELERRFAWEGNRYSKKQKALIKILITDAYRQMFPNFSHYPLSVNNVSISDVDPDTNIEYVDMLRDKRHRSFRTGGYYVSSSGKAISDEEGTTLFVNTEIDQEDVDASLSFTERVCGILHKKFLRNRKRKTFHNSADKLGLQKFLNNIFPLLARGYNSEEIAEIHGYELVEIDFWLKRIRKSTEIKSSFNLNKRRDATGLRSRGNYAHNKTNMDETRSGYFSVGAGHYCTTDLLSTGEDRNGYCIQSISQSSAMGEQRQPQSNVYRS